MPGMHRRKIPRGANTSETPEGQERIVGKKKNLPFIRSSKPAKRCSSPTNHEVREEQLDPFSHLLNSNSREDSTSFHSAHQNNDPHGAAYKQLGSLSGHRVCRQAVGTPNDAVISHSTSRVAVLPPWEKLISSKRRGAKRKLQKKTPMGGPWKTVDEHVEQLRRKTACLNRSLIDETNLTQKPVKSEKDDNQAIKLEETKPAYSLPNSSSKPEWIDIKAVSSAHQAKRNCTETELVKSKLLSQDSENEQGPAWRPAYVVGKVPEEGSNTQTYSQNWQDRLDQETIKSIIEASQPSSLRQTTLPYSNSENLSMHATQRNRDISSFMIGPVSHGDSSQRVPGSEQLDVNSLNSPWPNLWSPSPAYTNSTDKVHEE
ncbi:uncharacterized protein [Amphiura filiformis]|uniref:uncharacterized protein n=1 Tax=Amphiura filiformis TaxID=82378 RepID=UPI003B210B1E